MPRTHSATRSSSASIWLINLSLGGAAHNAASSSPTRRVFVPCARLCPCPTTALNNPGISDGNCFLIFLIFGFNSCYFTSTKFSQCYEGFKVSQMAVNQAQALGISACWDASKCRTFLSFFISCYGEEKFEFGGYFERMLWYCIKPNFNYYSIMKPAND